MRIFLLCVVLAVGVTSTSEQIPNSSKRFLNIAPLSDAQKTQIKEGFFAAKFIADTLDKKAVAGIAGQFIGKISSYLGAIGPFVGFALSLFGGPSAELTLLKRLFTQVENRFDLIDIQFAALRRQVAFVATQVHFTDIESNINAVMVELTTLTRVSSLSGYKYEANEFKHTYDRTYESSGIKLFQGIIHGGALTGGLFHEFMTFSKSDRKSTAEFMAGTLNLLMRAAVLEMTYAEINNDPNAGLKKRDWVTRFGQVKDKMLAIDRSIVQHYHTQMTDDVNTFAASHPKGGLSNTDFSSQLYNMITTKFYWRDWMVIAAGTYGHDKLLVNACEYNQQNNHGRSILLASVDKSKGTMNRHNAYQGTTGLRLYRLWIGHGNGHRYYHCVDAHYGYDAIPDSVKNACSTFNAVGVWCSKEDIHVHAPSNRVFTYTSHGANTVYLFG